MARSPFILYKRRSEKNPKHYGYSVQCLRADPWFRGLRVAMRGGVMPDLGRMFEQAEPRLSSALVRRKTMKSTPIQICLLVFGIWMLACVSALWGDPPDRVGRLNYLSGSVSFHPESVDEWAPATLNYPLTIGDHLWTDQDGQAEVHVGSTAIRLASNTEISFLNLNDQTIQIRLSTGSLNMRLRHLGSTEEIEVDTPNSSLSLLRAGAYRIDVQQSGDTAVTVRSGEVEVTAGSSVFPLGLRQTVAITGLDSPSYQIASAPALDDWDRWCQARDQKESKITSAQYVPRDEMSGVEDLDQYGSWSNDQDYGPVWTPTVTVAGWAPYGFGHWAWVDPWGWTWIDDAPWGFAPFHYGRWAFRRNAWMWVPGAHNRAIYAPALVTFVGGGGWNSSQAPGGSVGWFPLGPHERYIASYRSNPMNLQNVDIAHIVYANRNVPGAITVVPNETFIRGRPTAGVARLSNDELSKAPLRRAVAPLVPQKESFLGGSFASHGPVAHPPDSVISRPVVARLTPPPPVVPFAIRQQALAAHPGQPLDTGTLSSLRQSAPAVRSPVNIVTPGSPRKSVGQSSFSPQTQAGGNEPRQPAAGQARSATQPASRSQPQPAARQIGPAMQQPSRQPQPATGQSRTIQPARQPAFNNQPRPAPAAPRSGPLLIPRNDQTNQR